MFKSHSQPNRCAWRDLCSEKHDKAAKPCDNQSHVNLPRESSHTYSCNTLARKYSWLQVVIDWKWNERSQSEQAGGPTRQQIAMTSSCTERAGECLPQLAIHVGSILDLETRQRKIVVQLKCANPLYITCNSTNSCNNKNRIKQQDNKGRDEWHNFKISLKKQLSDQNLNRTLLDSSLRWKNKKLINKSST